ncbi:ABC transporter permease [Spirosoma terrae]|uniref:FtsX-like permease family protein n=1 Tax=Spirosoma terrae TaxID=1968276 RepID=A0A6L9LF53_9BACT|nr:ABC transporter permease [Spirosoma terrae]NDU99114.1 FtsX-like permease family protein [Spirosoma terrae]
MLKNYLKIAFRNLWKNKLYTGLNVGGLAIGLAACLVIVLYVRHEFSYDTHHPKADRIVRVTTDLQTPESPLAIASVPMLLAEELKRNYPEVETAVRFRITSAVVRTPAKLISEPDVYYADADVFSVFSFQFLSGNPATALTNPNSAVITEKFANAYFGQIDVLSKSLEINKETYQITGVIANPPTNSDMPVRALLSQKPPKSRAWLDEDFPAYTFVLFRNQPDLVGFTKKLDQLAAKSVDPELKKMGEDGYSIRFSAEPLGDVHYSQGKIEDTPKGNKQYSYLFVFLAAFVLVIALLNYINLLTAKATERAKEVGIRKANGAERSQLVRQFLFESLLLSGMALAGAVLTAVLVIPFFNELLTVQLSISWQQALLLILGIWLVVTLLGGLYPAFVLSGYQPVAVLKGTLSTYGQGAWLRRVIIVFQFVLAVCMIAGVLVVRRQMTYMQQYDIGFTREQILSVYLPDDSTARAGANALANRLKERSEVGVVTLGSGLANGPTAMASTTIQSNGKKRELMSNYMFIDDTFLPLLNIRLKAGRNLSSQTKADLNGGFLVNEAFVKLAGWKEGVGKTISGFGHKGEVVGVVKNFNYRSLHNPVEPLVMIYNTFPVNNVMLRIKPGNLDIVKTIWASHYPSYPFEYTFLDESFADQYRRDQLMIALFNGFAGLTVLVSCLGLFGLVAFTTERRTKEIGIRKVLGASVASIVALLSKDFLKLVLLAILLASPLVYWGADRWLQSFAYKVDLDWWTFALAGGIAIVIALITLSFQSIKAALTNPVKSLRNE